MSSINHLLYENMGPEKLRIYAVETGIVSCVDLTAIAYFLTESADIREYGPAYGRVIDYCLKTTSAFIFGIEAQKKSITYLKRKYARNPRVRIERGIIGSEDGDALNNLEHILPKADVVLASWGFLLDTLPINRVLVFEQAYKDLNKNGFFLVDLPTEEHGSIARQKGLELSLTTKYGTWETRIPDEQDLEAMSGGFSQKPPILYTTATNLHRTWKIFQKS